MLIREYKDNGFTVELIAPDGLKNIYVVNVTFNNNVVTLYKGKPLKGSKVFFNVVKTLNHISNNDLTLKKVIERLQYCNRLEQLITYITNKYDNLITENNSLKEQLKNLQK